MFLNINTINHKDEFQRIKLLFAFHIFLFFTCKLSTILSYDFNLTILIGLILWGVFYRFFYRMVKQQLYSFWTMFGVSVIVHLYSMTFVLSKYRDISLFYLYLISLVILLICGYLLYSPLYYPIVNWWEYDFRFRNDLIASVDFENKPFEARLIDLRKDAAGLLAFKDFEIGVDISIKAECEVDTSFRAKIITKKRNIIGRPFIYGVKFYIENDEVRLEYRKLQNFWNSERKNKQQQRFDV